MRAIVIVLFLLHLVACSSSNSISVPPEEPLPPPANPVLGTWELEDADTAIHFQPTGRLTIEPGHILSAINRLQNTQRDRYTSQLVQIGQYEVVNDEELFLHVTADWTGKGRGARRPAYKQVESTIVFELERLDQSTLLLNKKRLIQDEKEHINPEEVLQFTLILVE